MKLNSPLPFYFLKSLLTASILSLTILPILLLLSSANFQWIVIATLIWAMGSILVFHPFIKYIYPHLLSKLSLYLLTSILIIVSAWLNIILIGSFLPYETLYYDLFNTTLTQLSLFGTLYVSVMNAIIPPMVLSSTVDFYKAEKIF